MCVEIWHAAESRRLHIEPDRIGKLALDKLKPSDIDRLIVRLRDKGLAESTVRQIYHILRLALSGAVRDGLLARNPTGLVDRPVPPHKEARHLSPAELRSLLEAARSSRNHAVIALIAATGMRLREALALHWKDVDVLGGTPRNPAASTTLFTTGAVRAKSRGLPRFLGIDP